MFHNKRNSCSVTYTSPSVSTETTIGAANTGISLAQGESATITVYVNVDSGAAAGDAFVVYLGEVDNGSVTPFDNLPYTASGQDVYTTASGAVNGQREARADINASVASDAIPDVTLTAPTGPITPGDNIPYTADACNIGSRDLGNPYLVIPLPNLPTPAETIFAGFTGASVSYNAALEYSANGSSWTAATFATLPTSNVNYIRIALVPSPLAPGSANCQTITYDVTVPTTYNATEPVSATVVLTGTNSLGDPVSDTSGAGTTGTPTITTVEKIGGPFIGPDGNPQASGPTDQNDDFTEKVAVVTPAVAPGTPVASPPAVTFNNTLLNNGNADDTFTFTAPTVPPGSTVRVSFDNGSTWTVIAGPGATTATTPNVVKDATLDYLVEVQLPADTPSGASYPTTITATSVNDNTKSNSTIDEVLLGGFVNLAKSSQCVEAGTSTATDCIPGAEVIYTVTYTNFSDSLTASSLVITEDGTTAPNNWASYTTQVVGSASDSVTGTANITGDSVGSNVLTDTVGTLAPRATGTFTFRRKIN